jgi:hypothetical protein
MRSGGNAEAIRLISERSGGTEQTHVDHDWSCKLVAVAAGIVGLLMMLGGVGHLVAIVSVAISQHKPYDFRLVSLIATGGILLYPGLVNLAVGR